MEARLKVPGVAAKWLFILCLPVLLVAASLGWAVNSLWLYRYGFQEYNVSQDLADAGLELSDSEIEEVYVGLIGYFNSGEEDISLTVMKGNKPFELFNNEEVIHFRDVKGLIWLDYWILLGTFIYVLVYAGVSLFWRKREHWRQLALAIVGGSGVTIALMLALGLLGTFLSFGPLFYQFHLLFFDNPFWSAEGYMLLLFPEPFFRDAAILCALAAAGLAIIFGGAAGSYLKFNRSKTAP